MVTSAVSNASLATLAALRAHDVRVYAATSSARWVDRLRAIGAEDVLVVERNLAGFRDAAHVGEFAAALGGFDYVIDPFFDLHIEKAVEIMNPFGRYITCGLAGQNEFAAASAGVATRAPSANLLLGQMMLKNLTLIGNCIGLSSDLDAAVRDYERGSFRPPLDAVFSGDQAAGFLGRTFNDPDRFGKVAFCYEHGLVLTTYGGAMSATPALLMSVLAEAEAEAVIRLERAGARDAATARQVSRDDADLLARPRSEGIVRQVPSGAFYVDMQRFGEWQAERKAAVTSTPATMRLALIGGAVLLAVIVWFGVGQKGG